MNKVTTVIKKDGPAAAYEALFDIKKQEPKKICESTVHVGQFLWMQGQMPHLDVSNVLLLKNQHLGARDVRTFQEWAKEGIRIKKGERASKILDTKKDKNNETVLHIKNVFDVSQTTRSYVWDPICDNPKTHLYALIRVANVTLAKFKKITPTTKNAAFLKDENTFVINPEVDDALLMVHAAENAVYRLREQNTLPYYLEGDWNTRIKSAHLAAQLYVSRYGIEDPDGWTESLETLKVLDLNEREEMLNQARHDFVHLVEVIEPLFEELGKVYPLKDESTRGVSR